MSTTVTKESLATRIADLEYGPRSLKEDYTLAAYKMLLATMEAEPVAYIFKHPAGRLFWSLTDESNKGQNDVMPVYSSPKPAPVVPECFMRFHAIIKERHYGRMPEEVQNAFDECAAMLQAGNSPVIPGWIPVSEQMPEDKPGSYEYLVFETLNNRVNHDYWNVPDKGDNAFTPCWNYYGEHVTHWMPMPVFTQK